jgi:hypothetical protein
MDFTMFYMVLPEKNNDLPIINGDLTINTRGLTTKHGDVMGYNLESKEFLYPNSLILFS